MVSGMRRYTCAEESLSTWNQMSCGQAYLISSSSVKLDGGVSVSRIIM